MVVNFQEGLAGAKNDCRMSATNLDSVSPSGEAKERILIWLFSWLAAVHVFVFSAAFPVFNNMDEHFHFDLVVNYSHGHLPRGMNLVAKESEKYILAYSSPEFIWPQVLCPGGRFPAPSWTQPNSASSREAQPGAAGEQLPFFRQWLEKLKSTPNYESSQQPLYYVAAGLWWHIGQGCGLKGLCLLYWIRWLNILFVAALVWVGYVAARMVFPENLFLRLGVPALIAFIPQQAFYSIQNDVLSPLCFGLAFICLVRWMLAEPPGLGLGIATGLSLAATFLAKISNLPFLVVSVLVVLFKLWQWRGTGKGRAALPALAVMTLCAALPICGWMAWSKYAFGDFSGSEAKIQSLGWTHKPFVEWWHHPIFTPHGSWTFVSELLTTFWQGDFNWHANPLNLPAVDALYVCLSLCLLSLATVKLIPRFSVATPQQRQALWLGLGCFAAAFAFFGYLSVIYDFDDCAYPSREYPYFTSGRLILGALIPFLLLYVYGLDCLLHRSGNKWLRPLALAGMILFMLISEIITDWSVFSSQYNWYHA